MSLLPPLLARWIDQWLVRNRHPDLFPTLRQGRTALGNASTNTKRAAGCQREPHPEHRSDRLLASLARLMAADDLELRGRRQFPTWLT